MSIHVHAIDTDLCENFQSFFVEKYETTFFINLNTNHGLTISHCQSDMTKIIYFLYPRPL